MPGLLYRRLKGDGRASVEGLVRTGLTWAQKHLPGGTWAVPRLKSATRRRHGVVHARPSTTEGCSRQWSDGPRGPVVPDVPVDLTTMTVFRAEHFPTAGPYPWLDGPAPDLLVDNALRDQTITPWEARLGRYWARNGYVVVPGLLEENLVDHVWSAYEEAIEAGLVQPPEEVQFTGDRVPGRVLDPHLSVPEIDKLMRHPNLVRTVELLLGAESIPFQSISGHKASQQAIHSDSIHMTTYPTGYLVALWLAFEDIEPGSGPLEYYPGSHRLPVIYSAQAGIPEGSMRESGYREFDAKYTPLIRRTIEEKNLVPHHFHARKGDVLFWHANLLHGGSTRTDFARTRKALVFHYFANGCTCYHDLAASLSRIHA